MLASPAGVTPRGSAAGGAGKRPSPENLDRRDFLIHFCQGVGAAAIPRSFWKLLLHDAPPTSGQATPLKFQAHPHYRTERPLDEILRKVNAGQDEFTNEIYADQISAILAEWSAGLRKSPDAVHAIGKRLADDFSGGSMQAASSRSVRSDSLLEIRKNAFQPSALLGGADFLRKLQQSLSAFSQIFTAEFQITRIEAEGPSANAVRTVVRYELVGTRPGFHREQRIGNWKMDWQRSASGELLLHSWDTAEETQTLARSPIYIDIASAVFGANPSYAAQMMHGTDYWRTTLDAASGIDIYGHNGVSIADVDNDGLDDLYVCQPAGLPNRLYRNRGDRTFEDITDASGLGILENTACALFADFSNRGRQDVILVRNNGPVLFLNEGGGKFRLKPDAFRFTNPPQGTFVGAAVADYDRDGWLDIYFCLYAYYQGTGQYKYPSPYHDAENGPPNFLMRNNRDGTFRDVTSESGLNRNNTRYSFCCAWSDFDRDGWPDLYVVNDFGRKNLYHNNGNGTFTDVAAQCGVEDIGAGMSIGWLDYNNDGAQDLYVANMWTSAGMRVSMQENFKPASPAEIRALYQKHAMGNSLLQNRKQSFADTTDPAGAGIGRWAWSSDAFDFDHDGIPDLYIANGMVSGPSRQDLNSFFWRQVVAKSPDEAAASKDYEQGWQAINELIRSDITWSGYERNIAYANNRDGTFSDVSGAIGLDFLEDGRSFALADFDGDGRQEILLKNRNAPQLRLLRNVADNLPPAIAFRLQGTKSNRDAIGASITIETETGRQTRMLQAGSGFLSQHSKELFFGLGTTKGTVRATILWPSGFKQELKDLPPNHRIWIEEGKEPAHVEAFAVARMPEPGNLETLPEADTLPTQGETWLLVPILAPDFSLPNRMQQSVKLSALRGKPVLLNFWSAQSLDCQKDAQTFQKLHRSWQDAGLELLTIHLDQDSGNSTTGLDSFAQKNALTFPILHGSDEVTAVYNILYRQIYDRHRDLALPTTFLINPQGEIVKIYEGPVVPAHVEKDFRGIPASDSDRLARALPFPSTTHTLEFGRNYLSLGALFFQRGYFDQAEATFQRAAHEDPTSAEAMYGVGSVYLNQNKNAAARDAFEKAVKLHASYPATLPDSWNNLGVIATRENRMDDSITCFQQALRMDPHHQAALDNLGNAYRVEKRWDDARKVLERALELSPEDPEANYSLGMVFAQTEETAKAHDYLQRALKARPVYPEALNNLGILYLVTRHRDDAVANFEKCIQVAPLFDQAYLNLARVYALEGTRDKARTVLLELLKQHPGHPQARQMLDQLQE